MQEAGAYRTLFDGSTLASGTYLYTLEAATFKETRQLLIIK
jgi:hypothetical protein